MNDHGHEFCAINGFTYARPGAFVNDALDELRRLGHYPPGFDLSEEIRMAAALMTTLTPCYEAGCLFFFHWKTLETAHLGHEFAGTPARAHECDPEHELPVHVPVTGLTPATYRLTAEWLARHHLDPLRPMTDDDYARERQHLHALPPPEALR